MSIELISILLFGSMLLLLVSGLPVAFVIGGLAVVFTGVFWGPESLFIILARTFSMMSSTTLVAAPLFVLMAVVLERSGVAEDLYEMMYRWSGGVKGGLAVDIGAGMRAWLGSIPDMLRGIFGTGFLGYTVARSAWDKRAVDQLTAGSGK